MYYVYELVNLLGTVEYVGQSRRPKQRFNQHFRSRGKIKTGHGKFNGRQDVSMHIVAICSTKSEALQIEYDLQIFWGLPGDKDKFRGELSTSAKLTEQQVKEIKLLLNQNLSCTEIGKKFNVHRKIINNIKLKRNWSHIS